MTRRVAVGCLLACAAISLASPAWAQDSSVEARLQYQAGSKAFKEHKYIDAAQHFESAAALKPAAIAIYTAGLAWESASKPERAADAFSRALEFGTGLDDRQTNNARDHLATLEKTLGWLEVKGPDGWKVQLDANTEVLMPAKLHAAAGSHALIIRKTDKTNEKRDVTLEAGKGTPLELKDEPKLEPKPVDPEPKAKESEAPKTEALPPRLAHPFWTTPKVIGVGVAGVGVATLVGSIILGLNAKDAESAYQDSPTRPAFDHASSLQTWTNISIIAGAVLVAGGVALVVVPIGESNKNERSFRAGVTPGGMTLGGTF